MPKVGQADMIHSRKSRHADISRENVSGRSRLILKSRLTSLPGGRSWRISLGKGLRMYVDITYAHQPPMTRMYKNLLAAGYAMLCTHWYTIICARIAFQEIHRSMYTLNAFHWKNKKCLSTKGHLDVINGCWSESWRTLVVWKKRVVALLKLLSTYVEILQLSFKKVVGLLKLLIGIPERLWWSSDWGWMYRPDPLNQWFVEEGIKRINRPYSGLDVYIV